MKNILETLRTELFNILKDIKSVESALHSPHTIKHQKYHKELRHQRILLWKKLNTNIKKSEKLWGTMAVKDSEYIK